MMRCFTIAAFACLSALTPAAAADDDKPSTSVDAAKGGYTVKSGDNSLTFGMFAQIRATYEDKDEFDADTDADASGYGVADGASGSFDVARVRLAIRGTMFKPWLKYAVSYELGRTKGEQDAKFKDAYLELAGQPMAVVRAGQFKVPFSLQELSGDQSQQFVERAITNAFAPSRDAGVMLYGITESKKFGYQVGLFNGSGESKVQEDEGLMHALRVWWDPLGEYKLVEGTTDNPENHVVHVGAAYRGGEAMKGGTAGVFEDPNGQSAFGLELAWKYRRFFATGEYYAQTTEQANPVPGPDVDSDGWHVQTGLMVIPEHLELGLRYATVDFDNELDDNAVTEIRGQIGWYWKGHNLKLYGDLGQVTYESNVPESIRGERLVTEDVDDLVARLQLQLSF